MEIEAIEIEKPTDMNFILGQAHFAPKSAEDLYETLVMVSPGITFGLAFCEASDERLVRVEGNDERLKKIAAENALAIGAGHSFIIFLENAFPLNVLNAVKDVREVCCVFCATGNPARVIVADDGTGRGILGVIDGGRASRVENGEERSARIAFLRNIGYKLR